MVFRHRLSTRLWHWLNVIVLVIMLMSGLMIFNAHPRLYWGQYGANPDPAWLEIGSEAETGYLKLGAFQVETTGVLGSWQDGGGQVWNRAFPSWATIPSHYSLATARRWHLTFAWAFAIAGAGYALTSVFNGHLRQDLWPRRRELRPKNILRDIKDHLLLRFAHPTAERKYNLLQKLAYFSVIFVLLPIMLLSGLSMSPATTAAAPWLLDLFAGRQSARSVHFIVATLLVLFVLVHLFMIVASGPISEIRSMITGYFRLRRPRRK